MAFRYIRHLHSHDGEGAVATRCMAFWYIHYRRCHGRHSELELAFSNHGDYTTNKGLRGRGGIYDLRFAICDCIWSLFDLWPATGGSSSCSTENGVGATDSRSTENGVGAADAQERVPPVCIGLGWPVPPIWPYWILSAAASTSWRVFESNARPMATMGSPCARYGSA